MSYYMTLSSSDLRAQTKLWDGSWKNGYTEGLLFYSVIAALLCKDVVDQRQL